MLYIETLKNKALKDRILHFFEQSKSVRPRKIATLAPLERYIDHTLLKPEASTKQIREHCQTAVEFNFYSVCLPPNQMGLASDILSGSSTIPITVVGFPLGYSTTDSKLFEAQEAVKNGAKEIDMVLNISAIKSGDLEFALKDMQALVSSLEVPVKVIVETALLTQEEKVIACALVEESGADFIKTSTGFSSSGAQLEDIHLFYHLLEDRVAIKASGGIKTQEQAVEFLEAGCERLGTSSSVAILQGQVVQPGAY